MPDGSAGHSGTNSSLFARMPPHILGGLTSEQRNAIALAADQPGWSDHRINIRLSVPFLPKRWYITIVGGPERRGRDRRTAERTRNPLRTAGNFAFIFLTAVMFYGIAAAAMLITSSVLEY
jgi:hypothetical protein